MVEASPIRRLLSSPSMVAALICVLLGSIDLTVVASILPGMIGDLGVNTADIDRYIWAVNAYLIAYIVAIPLAGRVSDLVGRQPAFIGSLLIFLAGSILCATSDTLADLVIGRAVQGFGGGGLLPVALALAGDTLGRKGQLAGIGFVSAVETIGWILGPIYGAAVTGWLDFTDEPWRWVFWLNVPILAALLVALRNLSRTTSRSPGTAITGLDLPGAVLLTIALTTVNLALASGGEIGARTGTGLRAMGGTENPLADQIPWLLASAVISTILLIAWELRSRFPLLPITLYRQSSFLATIGANLCLGAVLMVSMVNVPVVVALTEESGNVSTVSAIMLAPFTIAIAAASLAAGQVARRLDERRTLTVGVAGAATGCLLVAVLLATGNVWSMIPGLVVAGIGLGLLLPALGTLPIQLAGASERGAAASSALMFRLLGMTVGVSTLTALGVRRLQTLTGRLDPIVRETDESTASFLIRQRQFIIDDAIPLSFQVIQETFVAAALIALVAAVPISRLDHHLEQGAAAESG
ncbi:MAG: MFS transporter [Chloroflexia bacterium]|nr:MFS transporter [Chloroflexia bacterium]